MPRPSLCLCLWIRENKRIAIFLLSVGIWLSLESLFFIRPYLQIISKYRPLVAQLKADVQALKNGEVSLSEINKKIEVLNKEIEDTNYLFPHKDDIANVLNKISKMASISGLNVLEVKPSEIQDIGRYRSVDFYIRVQGCFANIGKFIERIEYCPTYFLIKAISIERERDKEAVVPVLNLNLSVGIYIID